MIDLRSKGEEDVDVVTIAGNRPEIIKMSELVKLLNYSYRNKFVYTGQHFSANMRDVFLDELGITFDYDLRSNTSDILVLRENIRRLLQQIQPRYVIVYGDTNSTVAGALAAKDCGCKLFHIEAGLRCFDLSKPEERNRIQVDAISDYYLAPTELSKLFLKYESVPEERIFVTGNLITDVCKKFYQSIKDNKRKSDLPAEYILLTLHRPALVDNPAMLKRLSRFLSNITYKIIFPIHPRTKISLARYGITLPDNVKVIDALGYSEFLSLMKDALIILTDSGGVQEEAIILKRPCVTLNNTTERQETILLRANRLYHPIDGPEQQSSINDVITEMLNVKINLNPYGEDVTNRAYSAISNIIKSSDERVVISESWS
jgi:UDP-N-acetylglucosamine 2-epimerase (non-hydrolysing)